MLIGLQGIGGTGAAIPAREVFARTFANRRQLGSYLGLTPSTYDSGSTTRCQGISKAGNSWARRVLIEIAWCGARISRKPAVALVRGQDAQSVAAHSLDHGCRHGPQTRDYALAVRGNRRCARGRQPDEKRFLMEL
jgi:transposase